MINGIYRGLMIPGALLSLVAVEGCTMGWVRPNTSPDQECHIAAYGKYPERMVHIESDSRREPSRDEDSNSVLRDEEANYCMRQKGYSFEHLRAGA